MTATLILLASLAFIIFVEGLVNPFWIWNALPIVAAWLLLRRLGRPGVHPAPPIAFAAGAIGLTVYVHLAWYFDWGQLSTGSSTAAILFIFLPLVGIGAGVALWLVTRIALLFRRT